MKKIFLLFFMVAYLSGFAQNEFAPIGAKWYFPRFIPFSGINGIITYTSIGDTIIQNKNCRVVYKDEYSCYADNGKHYFHQSNDSIFHYDETDNDFNLLYIFGAQVGDSWEIQDLNFDHTSTCVVDSISYFHWSPDDSLKVQHIDFGSGFSIKLYENIGFDFAFFLPTGHPVCDDALESELRCYEDDTLGQIQFSSEGCVITSVETTPLNQSFQIFPNPTSDQFNIFSTSYFSEEKQFQLINLMGKIVKTFEIPTNETSYMLSVENLPSGIYFLHYLKNGESVKTEQVVISH